MRKLKESTKKEKKLRASQNKAKDVELKRIDIPNVAKAEIIRVNQEMENYLAGVAVGMGIKGKWSIDMRKMQFIVESNNDKKT